MTRRRRWRRGATRACRRSPHDLDALELVDVKRKLVASRGVMRLECLAASAHSQPIDDDDELGAAPPDRQLAPIGDRALQRVVLIGCQLGGFPDRRHTLIKSWKGVLGTLILCTGNGILATGSRRYTEAWGLWLPVGRMPFFVPAYRVQSTLFRLLVSPPASKRRQHVRCAVDLR